MNEQLSDTPELAVLKSVVEQGSFEDALQALEHVVAHLERGRLSIEEAVDWYEVGLRLSNRCTDLLDQAELRISTLEESFGIATRIDGRRSMSSADEDES